MVLFYQDHTLSKCGGKYERNWLCAILAKGEEHCTNKFKKLFGVDEIPSTVKATVLPPTESAKSCIKHNIFCVGGVKKLGEIRLVKDENLYTADQLV